MKLSANNVRGNGGCASDCWIVWDLEKWGVANNKTGESGRWLDQLDRRRRVNRDIDISDSATLQASSSAIDFVTPNSMRNLHIRGCQIPRKCCNGMKSLYVDADTKPDRQMAFKCMEQAVKLVSKRLYRPPRPHPRPHKAVVYLANS
ncbi:hypothetical protein E3N88_10004 [Mikania micrantha]|uniref:Uncharacterized protein n=1 Tax=Mikania micrantha TaxID=192012 RepID=A0A5N6P9L9_9ASTR|nr:hypothetical protein E3N88_10004 [Mikania micrantha]